MGLAHILSDTVDEVVGAAKRSGSTITALRQAVKEGKVIGKKAVKWSGHEIKGQSLRLTEQAGLSGKKLRHLSEYKAGGFGQINTALRTGEGLSTPVGELTDSVDDIVRSVDSVFDSHGVTLPKGSVTYRGLEKGFAGWSEGWTDGGFMSTATNPKVALDFNGRPNSGIFGPRGIMMKLKMADDTPGLVFGRESEVLLPRGARVVPERMVRHNEDGFASLMDEMGINGYKMSDQKIGAILEARVVYSPPKIHNVSPPALGLGMRTRQASPEAIAQFQKMNSNAKNLRITGTINSVDQARDFNDLLDDSAFFHFPGSMTPDAVARGSRGKH